MWLFWDLVSALPIFPRSKALKHLTKTERCLEDGDGHATLASAEERWIKLTEVVPKLLHLSLSLSLHPQVKGTAMCQTLGRWSRVSYRSGPRCAQSGREDRRINVQIIIYWAMGLRNHVQNVLNAQRMDRMRELTVRGSAFGRILKSK